MAKAPQPAAAVSKLRGVTAASAAAVTAGMIDQAPAMGLGTYFKIPGDWPIKRFSPEKNTTYKAMFLPWIAGSNNPTFKKGDIATNRYYPRHSMIGPNDEHFLCPYRASEGQRRCAICEKLNDLRLAGVDFDKIIKPKKAKNRELLFMHFPEHQDKRNLWVWDESVALFGDAFRAKIKKRPQYQMYWNLGEGGCIVEFEAREKKIQTNSCIDCTLAIEIEPRTVNTPEWLFGACEKYCIDNILIEQPPERLKKVVMQMGGGSKPAEPDAPDTEPSDQGEDNPPEEFVEPGPGEDIPASAADGEPAENEEVVDEEEAPAEDAPEETVEETVEEPTPEEVMEEVLEETYEEVPADPEEPEEPEPAPPPPPKKPAPRPAASAPPKPAPKPAAPPPKPAPKPATAAAPARPPARPPGKPAPKK